MAQAAVDRAAAGVSYRGLEQCPLTSWPGEGPRSSADHSRFRKPDCDARSLEHHGGWLFHGIPSSIRRRSIPGSHIFVTIHYNVSTQGAAVVGTRFAVLGSDCIEAASEALGEVRGPGCRGNCNDGCSRTGCGPVPVPLLPGVSSPC